MGPALSGAVGAVRALRWVAVVLLQEQQVARVLGFVLHGVPGASRDRGPASVGSLCVEETPSRLCQREPRKSCRRQCVQEPPSENKWLVAVSIHIQNSIVFTLFK